MKKLMALCLILCLLTVAAIVPAYAAEVQPIEITEEAIIQEISRLQENEMQSLRRQLEAQDALDMLDEYAALIMPEIEMGVWMKYGLDPSLALPYADGGSVQQTYVFNYGGYVANQTKFGTYATTTYMNRDRVLYYLLSVGGECKASTIIQAALGSIPAIGTYFTIAFTMKTLYDADTYLTIRDDGLGYAKIVSIASAGGKSSVLSAWTSYPYAGAYNYSSGTLEWEAFSDEDPFL